jgi:hypothetical protein
MTAQPARETPTRIWVKSSGRLDVEVAAALLQTATGAELCEIGGGPVTPPVLSRFDGVQDERVLGWLGLFLRQSGERTRATEAQALALAADRTELRPDCLLLGIDEPEPESGWLTFGIEQRAIVACVSSFGLQGPYAGRPGSELTTTQLGGFGYFIPGQVADLDRDRPLPLPKNSVAFLAGLITATATLPELYARLGTAPGGRSAGVVVVSVQVAIASLTFVNVSRVAYGEAAPSRSADARPGGWTVLHLRCSDGFVCVVTLEEPQWLQFVHVLGDPEWAANPLFADKPGRSIHLDAIRHLVEEVTAGLTVSELVQLCSRRKVPCAPVSSMENLLKDEQLYVRSFFNRLHGNDGTSVVVPDLRRVWSAADARAAVGAP